jgi:hypothetical protein
LFEYAPGFRVCKADLTSFAQEGAKPITYLRFLKEVVQANAFTGIPISAMVKFEQGHKTITYLA